MKKIISFFLVMILLIPTASAIELINLSEWSYKAVSEIVASDLLCDCLKGATDYRRTINRGEFYELVYNVIKKNGMVEEERSSGYHANCEDYPAVNKLDAVVFRFKRDESRIFNPREPATREWAAQLLHDVLLCANVFNSYYIGDSREPETTVSDTIKDFAEIQNGHEIKWIIEYGVMTDLGNGYFMPDAEMSIEQAITAVHRMYKLIPKVLVADNESGYTDRNIGAGITEEITDEFYNIKKGDKLLLSLETDVYQKVLAGDYKDTILVFAVNFNNKTDVFDAATGEILYTIPYIVNELDSEKDIAFTLSGKYMPYYSGAWSFDNKEIYPPEYSRYELSQMLSGKTDEYRAPDGVIYYSNWNDNGNMYKTDTNGENNAEVVDGIECDALQYINGKIFFNDKKDYTLYCVNPDGTGLDKVSEKRGNVMAVGRSTISPYSYDKSYVWGLEQYGFYEVERGWYSDSSDVYDIYGSIYKDKSVIYYEATPDAYSRKYKMDNGDVIDDYRDGMMLYRYTEDGKSIKLADFYINEAVSANNGDGKVYFMDAQTLFETGSSPIYVNDNDELRVISGEYTASEFGFVFDHEKQKADYTKIGFITQDEVLKGTYHTIDLKTGKIEQAKLLPEYDKSEESEKYYDKDGKRYLCNRGDEHAKVFYLKDDRYNMYAEYNGKTTVLGEVMCKETSGQYVYFIRKPYNMVFSVANSSSKEELNTLKRLDCVTGEITVVTEDYSKEVFSNDGVLMYETSLGEIKMIDNNKDIVTVYPCKGVYRYSETDKLFNAPKNFGQKECILKYSKDGTIMPLTSHDALDGIFIPNNEPDKYYQVHN